MKMYKKLTKYPFLMGILMLGLPVAIQNLLICSMSAIDTLMVSRLGEATVGAVGICNQYNQLFNSALYGFSSTGALFIAQYWGVRDGKGISRSYGVMVIWMAVMGLIFIIPALTIPDIVMKIYTDKAELQVIGSRYLRLAGISYLFQCLIMGISTFLRSVEKVKIPLISSAIAVFTNTFLNWVLIFGKLGMPKLGVEGAAIATILSNVLNFTFLLLVCVLKKYPYMWNMKAVLDWKRGFIKEYIQKLTPIFANEMLMGVAFALINVILGRQPKEAIAAVTIFRVLEGFIFAFFNGFFNASSVMIGKKVGAGKIEAAMSDAKKFAWVCPLVTLVPCLLLVVFRHQLPAVFSIGQTAAGYLSSMLIVNLIFCPIRMSNYIQNADYRAGGQAIYGTVLELVCIFGFSIPLIWLVGIRLTCPFILVFASMYFEDLIKLFIEIRYTLSGKWIRPVTNEGKTALIQFKNRRTE
ncbi:MAG: MATE family efflux transporter [Verrucomicrobiae bacterium]|nr:MATE family efflux transporter [Verrucomicrobiae bacterium]